MIIIIITTTIVRLDENLKRESLVTLSSDQDSLAEELKRVRLKY